MNNDNTKREQLAAARRHGLAARHRTKLARVSSIEQTGASLALAALSRDHETIARILDLSDDHTVRQAAALALGALAELGLAGRPTNVTKARDALARLQTATPHPPAA